MSNIVIDLFDGLSKATAQSIYPQDLADLLGYGKTQLKEYVREARKDALVPWDNKRKLDKGEVRENLRLERAAEFAVLLGQANGFESLFPYIQKLSGNLDDAEWLRRQRNRVGKMIPADPTTKNQISIDDVISESETAHLKTKGEQKVIVDAKPESDHLKTKSKPEAKKKKAAVKQPKELTHADIEYPDFVTAEMKDSLRASSPIEIQEVLDSFEARTAILRYLKKMIEMDAT